MPTFDAFIRPGSIMETPQMAVRAIRQFCMVLLVVTSLVSVVASSAGAQRFDPSPQASPAATPAAGIVGPTTYESPQFGIAITWDEPWEADRAATESNQAIALDRLSLVAGTARFQAFFVAAEGETPAEYADRFIDFRLSYEPSTTIVQRGERRGVSWLAYRFESQGQTAVGVVEVSLTEDGRALQVIEDMEYEDLFKTAFVETMDLVQVGGAPPFRVLTGWPE
jgi:hypothetical protein